MRELRTREEIEKKEKRNKVVLGIIMAVLMLLSTAGYALLNNESTSKSATNIENNGNSNGQIVEYNGIKFVGQESGLWAFEVQGNTFYSSYTPKDVSNINVPYVSIQTLAGQTIYYSGDAFVVSEIMSNINPFIMRAQEACYKESNSTKTSSTNQTCSPNLPIKDCNNNFIIISETFNNETPRITVDNKCIIIKSKDTELLKSADALLFRILGI